MLRLELRHYETVVAIVDHGTMTAAARQLSSSQSALSHRLAEAERRLGVKLFDRGPGRRLRPTRAGLAVHQSATRALGDLERSEDLLVVGDPDVIATVRIAMGTYESYHWYPSLYTAARELHPDIELQLVSVGDSPGPALADEVVDLVIAPGQPSGAVDVTHLFDDALVCVVAPGHRLAGSEWISPEDLADETYLTYNLVPAPGFEYDRFIRPSEVYPRLVTVVAQTSAIVEMVAAGVGVAILSRWALNPVIEAGRVVPIRCSADGLTLPWVAGVRSIEADDSPARRIAQVLSDTRLGSYTAS